MDPIEMLKEMLREALKDDELFELGAKATRKGYLALLNVGFTKEQATEIIAGQGVFKANG